MRTDAPHPQQSGNTAWVDLGHYYNPNPYTIYDTRLAPVSTRAIIVTARSSLSRMHGMFRQMGLRHLVVVNHDNQARTDASSSGIHAPTAAGHGDPEGSGESVQAVHVTRARAAATAFAAADLPAARPAQSAAREHGGALHRGLQVAAACIAVHIDVLVA